MEPHPTNSTRVLDACTALHLRPTTARRIAVGACLVWLALVVLAAVDLVFARWLPFAKSNGLDGLTTFAGAMMVCVLAHLASRAGPQMPPKPTDGA